MPEDDTSLYVIILIAVVAMISLGLSLASFATHQTIGGMIGDGGMMGTGSTTTGSTGPGAPEWTVLVLSVAFFALAVVVLVRSRGARRTSDIPSATTQGGTTVPAAVPAAPTAAPGNSGGIGALAALPAQVPEPTLVKLLDEDERRMYLEIRDHGGEMLQRDLVALGIFSKAKVTRVLDKLETKGLVVREAHGMTNRVRLVPSASR